jgi:hypothetical protein
MFTVNGFLLSLLIWGSISILRNHTNGIKICCLAYAAEISYVMASKAIIHIPLIRHNEDLTKFAESLSANGVLGNYAISAQMQILYPALALTILGIIHWRVTSARSPRAHPVG